MTYIYFLASAVCFILYRLLFIKQKRDERKKRINEALLEFQSIFQQAQQQHYLAYSQFQLKKIIYNDLLEENGFQDLINNINYALTYFYRCTKCKEITDVKSSEGNHHRTMRTIMTHGRLTKDGDYDQRFNTEFEDVYTYFFDAICNNCKNKFTVKLNSKEHSQREKLKSE